MKSLLVLILLFATNVYATSIGEIVVTDQFVVKKRVVMPGRYQMQANLSARGLTIVFAGQMTRIFFPKRVKFLDGEDVTFYGKEIGQQFDLTISNSSTDVIISFSKDGQEVAIFFGTKFKGRFMIPAGDFGYHQDDIFPKKIPTGDL